MLVAVKHRNSVYYVQYVGVGTDTPHGCKKLCQCNKKTASSGFTGDSLHDE